MKKLKIILSLFSLFQVCIYSQDCKDYQNWGNCKIIMHRDYKLYLHPVNTAMGVNDTISLNIVFVGKSDYVITFCTDLEYYPINIRLIQPETKKVLYDNSKDDYFESLGVGFYNTQNMILEVNLLAKKLNINKKKIKEIICVNLSMQRKPFE